MDRRELHVKLQSLHDELAQVGSLNDSDRASLEHLARDIKMILEKEHEDASKYEGLSNRLRDAVAQLEASHPKATMSMREVIDQIAFLGI